ncbi:uncharacterized protein L969DRAFT_568236 [Mixia osmundae IAM 14324]|uniref:Magnesium transporter protein 1 n=1 Tax=Mixia osmundae (strain CBS 9802 / IAM 14324 / JCM 22182 / KY 12970) TaxID=764103 RepID=G7DX03_MIXOS|nr:uncharacterized protein L969DRAFT_568236 [Mixia osmundae IAM 14324]KEI38091.1 hypothetical protein L969DRAFT_568236 [Mixia osmundae IAM 14324]GAA95100.1 hypothetical protein E5Q_01755 [Mixia osmundae IAM 14324]
MRLLWLTLAAAIATARADKVAKFESLARANGGVVKLTSASYDELVASPRNYSASVIITALGPQFSCKPCQIFDGEHRLVARSFQGVRSAVHPHFFGVLDFEDGQEIFRRLQLSTAPNGLLYYPTEGPEAKPLAKPDTYEFNRNGPTAEPFAAFLNARLGVHIPFRRPPDYNKIGSLVVIFVGVIGLSFSFWPHVKLILSSKALWSATTIASILLFTSGHMWNQIRHPLWAGGQPGKIEYVQGGFSSQYAVETQIVMGLYGLLAFSAYTIGVTLPKVQDPLRQRLGVYVWLGIFLVVFGALMGIFRIKNPGYPFHFIF